MKGLRLLNIVEGLKQIFFTDKYNKSRHRSRLLLLMVLKLLTIWGLATVLWHKAYNKETARTQYCSR